MAKLLRDWIAPVVKSELTSVLENPNKDDVFETGQSPLRRHLTKPRHVQIIHLGTGLHDQISDGTTYVQAEFDEAAAESFQQSTSRSFLDLRVIRFFVRAWKLKGSEGSGTFGNPSNIMQDPGIQQIVENLTSAFQTGPEDQTSVAFEPPSSIRSQDGNPSDIGTQMATQIQSGQGASTKANEVPESARPNLLALLKRLPKDSASSKTQALEPPCPAPANSILKPVSEQRAKGMLTKLEAKANKQQDQFLTQYHPSSSASIVDNHTVAVKQRSAEPMLVYDDSEKENSQESLNSAMRQAAKHQSTATKPRNAENGVPSSSNETEKDNSQESLPSPKRAVLEQESNSAQPRASDTNTHKPIGAFVDMFQDSNPFEGFKRVPRKFVRIPDAQQVLLERRDSWYKPSSEGRPIYATIPPNVREQMDAFLNRQFESGNSDQSDDGSDEPAEGASSDQSEDEDEDEDEEEHDAASRREEDSCEEAVEWVFAPGKGASVSSQQLRQLPALALDIGTGLSSSGLNENEEAEAENLDIDDESSRDRSVSRSPSLVGGMDEPEDPQATTQSLTKEELATQPQSTDDLPARSGRSLSTATSRLPSTSQNKPVESLSAVLPQIHRPMIPPSSPVEEDELPLEVPLGVDDIVEDEQPPDAPETSQQKLPRTAPTNPRYIQVPATVLRADGTSLPQSREMKGRTNIDHSSQDIPSSLIIPSTFDNLRPVDRTSIVRDRPRQESPIVQIPATSRKSEQPSAFASSPVGSRERIDHGDDASLGKKPASSKPKHCSRTSTTESDIGEPIVGKVFKEMKQRFISNYRSAKVPQPKQDTIARHNFTLDPKETRPSGTHAVTEEVRISSTYVEGSPRNSMSSKEHIHPISVYPNSEGANQEEKADPEVPSSQVGSELRSPSPDSAAVVRDEEFDSLPFASQEVVDQRSPSPDDTRMAQEEGPNVPSLLSQAVSDPESPSLAVDAAVTAEEEVEEQHDPSQGVSGREDLVPEDNAALTGEELAESQHAPSRGASDPEHSAPDKNSGIVRMTVNPESADLCTSSQIMFYEEFKATYLEYEGSRGSFTRALVNLEWLQTEARKKIPTYYDDFVMVMASDHRRHVEENRHFKERLLTGIDFYNTHVPNPVYKYNVISARNVVTALSTLDPQEVKRARFAYWKTWEKVDQLTSQATDVSPSVENHGNDIILNHDGTDNSPSTQDRSSARNIPSPPRNRAPVLKKRFFETASQQVNLVQQKAAVDTPNQASRVSYSGSDGKQRSGKQSQQMSVLKQRDRTEAPSGVFRIGSIESDTRSTNGRQTQQVITAKQRSAVGSPNRASQLSSNGSGCKSRSHRTLPWLTEQPNNLASLVTPRVRDSPSRSSAGGRSGKANLAELKRERKRQERAEAAHALENVGSPILGSLRDHVSPPEPSPSPRQTKRKRISESFTFGEQDDPFTENLKPSKAARRVTMPASRSMDDLRNVSHEKKRKRAPEGSLSHENSFTEALKPSKAARRVTLPAAKSNQAEEWLEKTPPPRKMTSREMILERIRLSGRPPKSETIEKLTALDFGTVKKLEIPAEPETQ
ncbi:uncharacterized protein PAC_05892 [Phialocephala subalpina]|uniref:Telomere replication protein EST3 n=1 Tax=Phialocephala subalpina TaxID=576137 RepID=A0A1L7WT98_9HELO|nr:uncharacterized protein PAC_05892 [Phialocephala subalpina]